MARASLVVGSLLVASGCTCGPSITRAFAEIDVEPASLDFGDVHPQVSRERSFTILNRGSASLTITSAQLTGSEVTSFAFASSPPTSLGPSQAAVVKVLFSPRRVGNHAGRVVISSNASNAPELLVPLVGTASESTVGDAGPDSGVSPDAGTPDAGTGDAGLENDAGSTADAGVAMDAGPDGGPPTDAGMDGGTATDAGVDAGATTDAGAPLDAGVTCDVTPAGWPTTFAPWANNPVMLPATGATGHGLNNIYAPDLHQVMGQHVMWYGAQGSDGHDRIFMAWSRDRVEWRKWPSDTAPQAVLDRGTSNHVNDPSLVIVSSGSWAMYYTDADVGTNDRIWVARNTPGNSNSLTAFTKDRMVLSVGPAGSWDADKVGRPSVLLEGGVYKMWFDGQRNGVRHVGYATSTDGVTFTKHPANPVVLNAGAVDVKRVGSVYVMVAEARDGTYWYTSPDGICWASKGRLFGLSGGPSDAFGQVTPFLEVSAGVVQAVWYGAASATTWDRNRIAVAFPNTVALPPGGGCTGCVATGQSCPSACFFTGASTGVCGSPGSTSAGMCCACSSEGCDQCRGGGAGTPDCNARCISLGKAGGWCAYPGSTNASQCCGCLE